MRWSAVPTALVFVWAACSPFGAESSGGAETDAGTEDARNAGDGAIDGGAAEGGAGFCADAGAHTFCDDFDGEGLEAKGWGPGDRRNVDAGRIETATSPFLSPPNALALDMTSVASTGLADANFWLQRAFPSSATRKGVFSVALRLDQITALQGDGGAYLLGGRAMEIVIGTYYLEVSFTPKTEGYALTVYETSSDGSVAFSAHDFDVAGADGPPLVSPKAWHRVQVSVDLANDTLSALVDGAVAVETTPKPWKIPSTAPTGLLLRLGGKTDASSTRLAFAYDDVTVDLASK